MKIHSEYTKETDGNDCLIRDYYARVTDDGETYILHHHKISGSWTGEHDYWETCTIDGALNNLPMEILQELELVQYPV